MPVDLVNEVCCHVKCGVDFAIPRHVYDQARRLGMKRLYACPNGHEQGYTESEEDRLKKRVGDLEARRDTLMNQVTELNAAARADGRRISALRGVVSRLRRKLAGGRR